VEEESDRVGPPVSVQERGKIPIRVFPFLGCGLDPQLGRNGSLRPSFIFIFVYFFSFSVFYFFSQILYKFFKQCQTNFKSFIKFKTTSQNSNNHVFLIK
jgi:hypothetical protein